MDTGRIIQLWEAFPLRWLLLLLGLDRRMRGAQPMGLEANGRRYTNRTAGVGGAYRSRLIWRVHEPLGSDDAHANARSRQRPNVLWARNLKVLHSRVFLSDKKQN